MVFPAFVEKGRAGAVRPAGHMGPDVARVVRRLHFDEPFEQLPKKQANVVVAANANQGGEVKVSLKPVKGKSPVKERGSQAGAIDWKALAKADREARKGKGSPNQANVVVAANDNQGVGASEVKVSLKSAKQKTPVKKIGSPKQANVVVADNQGINVTLMPVPAKTPVKERGSQAGKFDWWGKAKADREARKVRVPAKQSNVVVAANANQGVNVTLRPVPPKSPVKVRDSPKKASPKKANVVVAANANQGGEVKISLKPAKQKTPVKERGSQAGKFDWKALAQADLAARKVRGRPRQAQAVVVADPVVEAVLSAVADGGAVVVDPASPPRFVPPHFGYTKRAPANRPAFRPAAHHGPSIFKVDRN